MMDEGRGDRDSGSLSLSHIISWCILKRKAEWMADGISSEDGDEKPNGVKFLLAKMS